MTGKNSSNPPHPEEYVSIDKIQKSVYLIRGEQVMLDKDLAEIYGYEVKAFNQQVKRNLSRFPADFMFQLTREELPECLKSQFVTLNSSDNKRDLHIKKLPYAFTEQGIYMLATVLRRALPGSRGCLSPEPGVRGSFSVGGLPVPFAYGHGCLSRLL
ncbi:MAG TPA: ORF6N domain-containing protein [Methanocorpusculum sp.]|nr:ORF6N domain-containing protein [Methanocorpusculum sp.]HJJ44266.1 ORF6N domain-containing protein [Methanocorpusculum sp.]HJJ57892.1 ORF6N domain-containing protein [Methanocorpusculum sp.]